MTNEPHHVLRWLAELLRRKPHHHQEQEPHHQEKEIVIIMADALVNITINVSPASTPPPPPLTVDASGVSSSAQVGTPYSGAIVVTGGVPPYTFTLESGALPDGISLGADGSISGTPTTAGSFTAGIDVTDSEGTTASARVAGAVR